MDEAGRPVAGTDYPATWSQFLDWFGEDAACARYLERLCWPTGGMSSIRAATARPLSTGAKWIPLVDPQAQAYLSMGSRLRRRSLDSSQSTPEPSPGRG